ncbi:hypothetical protein TRAPUB_7612 [Trametes pubescens]|uniref:Uncharacterized protein n=1 Tax=Trametes pubescens TaxID=154538 RepID=A0A1M2V2W4_TRAPU|nr:hypothetical protein TRAPUB_7612 [Trametes pubescens]
MSTGTRRCIRSNTPPPDDPPHQPAPGPHQPSPPPASAGQPEPEVKSKGKGANQPPPNDTHDLPPAPTPDLSRSLSARGASRLSSSFFPALAKARLALAAAASSSPPPPTPRDMRSSSAREQTPKPKPLLILKLSGSSYLDTIIRDDKSKDPVYILETVRELTNIYRLDHPRDEPVKAATVQWPLHPVRVKGKSGRMIQFGNGSWREAEDLLKNGPLGSTAIRKFSIPHYPNSLKWKLIPGNCFCCVTNAVKGPVAVLDAATLSAPPRLKVYHPLIERDVARSQDNYKGVPTVFLDYLVITSLLLVTDVQEWLDRPREARIPGSSSYTIQRWLALIHDTPAPPEPQHPTVDLSLTVPSTPPQSATFPSPGAYWETQSGVTSLTGSNGSGSGTSYMGELFTPITPVTSATSANSSAFFPRPVEDAPPLPPMPGSTSSSASPFAHNAELGTTRVRERPKSNPQSMTHSANSSSSNADTLNGSQSHVDGGEPPVPSQPRSRSAHTLSLPGNAELGMPSTSAPTSPLPISGYNSPSSASRSSRRQLPVPPGPVPANSFAQPWLYGSSSPPSTSSNQTPLASPSTPPTASSAARARASMRGTIRTSAMPPPQPPPQHSIPLPPKLAREQQSYGTHSGARPRTAPELENGGRRRHSESFSPGQFGELSPVDDAGPSVHPYASATPPASFSLRGGDDVHDITSQMRGLSTTPGPSSFSESRMQTNHIRAPSQAAPDYDTHSFVNSPPPSLPPLPLPVPPASSSGTGSRPVTRRQLTVVNADVPTQPQHPDPGLGIGSAAACPPPPGELRLNPRISYADSVYEMPPPAYDAIDFSVRYVPVPPVPPIPTHLAVVPTRLPVPLADAGAEGQRSS